MRVMRSGSQIATLEYITDTRLSVTNSRVFVPDTPRNTPLLLSSQQGIQSMRTNPLDMSVLGYQIIKSRYDQELDETISGPIHTSSIGDIAEVSGVGWTGNNTMLLSYA